MAWSGSLRRLRSAPLTRHAASPALSASVARAPATQLAFVALGGSRRLPFQLRCSRSPVQPRAVVGPATPAAGDRPALVQRRDGVCAGLAAVRAGRQNPITTPTRCTLQAQARTGSTVMATRSSAASQLQPRANPSFKRRRPTAGQLGRATHQAIVAPRGQAGPPRVAA